MNAVFDQAHFDHMTAGDAGLQAEVVALFRTQVESWRAAGEDWRAAVHTMKGSARGIGLHALALACENAETASDTGAALERVHAELETALAALERIAPDAG